MKKTSILLCFILICSLSLFACAKESESKWNDGSYEGKAEGVHGDIQLLVTIEKGAIKSIDVTSQAETSGVSEVAFTEVPKSIIDSQSTDVETVTGATVSSEAIITAVNDALNKATK